MLFLLFLLLEKFLLFDCTNNRNLFNNRNISNNEASNIQTFFKQRSLKHFKPFKQNEQILFYRTLDFVGRLRHTCNPQRCHNRFCHYKA